MRNLRNISSCALLAIGQMACSTQDVTCVDADGTLGVCQAENAESAAWAPEPPDSSPLSDRLQALDRDLNLGSAGAEVRAVHEYLTQFGYFPNDVLREEYPMWRPIVADAPADPEVFDARTLEAVSALQRFAGLAVTGSVDEPTRASLRRARCSMPEGIVFPDPSEKFAHYTQKRTRSAYTWKVDDDDLTDLSNSELGLAPGVACDHACKVEGIRTLVASAFAEWEAATGGNLPDFIYDQNAAVYDLGVRFEDLPGLGLGNLPGAEGTFSTLKFDDNGTNWFLGTAPVAGRYDMKGVAMHEIGHLIGLQHSSVNGPSKPAVASDDATRALMYFESPTAGQLNRTLHVDDTVAVSLLYENWARMLDQGAKDIAIGGDGDADGSPDVWVIGVANTIHKWTGNPTLSDPAVGGRSATRISVSPTGRPWIVSTNGGQIYEGNTTDPMTQTWTRRGTASNCATDIGVGGTSTSTAVYILGCPSSGVDARVYKWSGSAWVLTNPVGWGYRIAVDGSGLPWIVSWADGFLYWLSSTSWERIGAGGAMEIGGGPVATALVNGVSTPIRYVYSVNGNGSIWMRNRQPANPADPAPGSDGTQSRNGFVQGQGSATHIAVGPDGVPWVLYNDGNLIGSIWRQN